MQASIKSIEESFSLLFANIISSEFSKTLHLESWNEKKLLPLIRTFLLGYYGKVMPEKTVKNPIADKKRGRIDFLIGNTAVELAVRAKGKSKYKITARTNRYEIAKLLKHRGRAVLILFDFTKEPLSEEDLQQFRNLPAFGKGNHCKTSFSILYFYFKKRRPLIPGHRRLNIRCD